MKIDISNIKSGVVLLLTMVVLIIGDIKAQDYDVLDSLWVSGRAYPAIVVDGDTMILATLDDMSFTSIRSFKNIDDKRRFRRYQKYASQVYPYAKDAIDILTKIDLVTKDMKGSKKKKYIKQTYKQLEKNFKEHLKTLTKTQGLLLIKMIEKETGDSFYQIIKEKRNVFTALYWNQMGKMYDYDLKEGYTYGEDYVLDAVLMDFDVSYKTGQRHFLRTRHLVDKK